MVCYMDKLYSLILPSILMTESPGFKFLPWRKVIIDELKFNNCSPSPLEDLVQFNDVAVCTTDDGDLLISGSVRNEITLTTPIKVKTYRKRNIDIAFRAQWERTFVDLEIPTFDNFVNLFERYCRSFESLASYKVKPPPRSSLNVIGGRRSHQPAAVMISTSTSQCVLCNASHAFYKCPDYLLKDPKERFNFIKQARLSLNCL
uniref:Uncharacterized protein n=1 Tax=Timema shepardi TaxID=629360 RepID=A0A7R9G2H9_TIMSH|nr:unnamed protein product [Timema shepardi]